jgi:hypothetical protein
LALTSDPMSVPEQRPVRLGGALQRGARASMSRQNHATEVARPRELVHLRALALTCCFSNGFVFERPSRTFPASPASPVCSSPDTRSRGRPGEAPLVRFRSPSAHVSHAAYCFPVLPGTGRSRFGVVGRSCCTRLTPRALAGPSALAVSRSEAATGPWMLRRKVPVNRGRRLVGSCVGPFFGVGVPLPVPEVAWPVRDVQASRRRSWGSSLRSVAPARGASRRCPPLVSHLPFRQRLPR